MKKHFVSLILLCTAALFTSTGASMLFDESGRLVARAKQFEEDLLVVDVDVRPAFRRRLLDPRGRSQAAALPEVAVSEARLGEHREDAAHRAAARRRCRRCTRRSCSAPATTCARTAFTDVLIATLRWDRLVAGRGDRGRRPRPRAGGRGAHAVAVLERGQRHRRRRARREPRDPHGHRPDRAGPHRVPRHARADVRRHRARSGRGEPPGPDPGHDPHDDVEQVRRPRAHHRQQERDGHRLLDPLRRHGRRLLGDQGRAEDARVRAVRATATSGRCARSSPTPCSRSRRARSCAPTRRTPTRCPSTRCSTRSSRATSKTTSRSPSSRPPGIDSELGAARRPAGRPQRVQATAGAARRARVAEGVRQGPPSPDHQPLARLAPADADEPRALRRRGRARRSPRCSTASRSRSSTTRSTTSRRSRTSLGRFGIATLIARCRWRCPRCARAVPTGGCSCAPGSTAGVHPVRRVRDADRRPAVHVAVDVGVHHRALRGDHAGDRVGDQPAVAASAGHRRHRDRDRRPVPADRRRRAPRARRDVHARVRGAVRVPHRVRRRVRATVLRPSQFTALQIGAVALLSIAPAAEQGVGIAHRARGVRGRLHRASRAPRSRCRSSCGVSGGSPRRAPR